MKKIGLFYAANAVKTSQVAKKIRKVLGAENVDIIPAEQAWGNDFEAYDNLIIGVSTWFDGELPTYWDELIPELETLDLKGKRVALFGLGDQVNYPDNFADGLGLLGDAFEKAGASLVGVNPTKDYSFNRSKALRGNEWCGLVLDFENQSEMTDGRIKAWCDRLRAELL